MSTKVDAKASVQAQDVLAVVRRHWLELLAWLAFFAFWIPTFQYFLVAWGATDSYYSHGYLIPFMSGWTAWLRKDEAGRIKPHPSLIGLGLLFLTLAAATVFGMQNSLTMRGLMFPISVAFFVASVYGWKFVKLFAFPIFYLFFMCPIPEFILTAVAFKVQVWSTFLATHMSKLFLIDANQVGTGIQTDYVSVEVGTPCSGFRMLVALTAFAIFLVYAMRGNIWRKLLFVVIAMPLSVMVNSLRVALLVVVGHYWDPNLVPVFHDYSGYVVLIVAFVVMFWIAKLLGCKEFRLMDPPSGPQPPQQTPQSWLSSVRRPAAVALVVAGLFTLVSFRMATASQNSLYTVDMAQWVPLDLQDWSGVQLDPAEEWKDQLPAAEFLARLYSSEGTVIELLMIESSDPGSFHSPMFCLPGAGWIIKEAGQEELQHGRVSKGEFVQDFSRLTVRYWYLAGNKLTGSLWTHKYNMLMNKFQGTDGPNFSFRVTVRQQGARQPEDAANEFADAALAHLKKRIASTEPVGKASL